MYIRVAFVSGQFPAQSIRAGKDLQLLFSTTPFSHSDALESSSQKSKDERCH